MSSYTWSRRSTKPMDFREALAVRTGTDLEHFDDFHRDDEGEHDEERGDRDEQGVGEDLGLQAPRLLRVGARELPHDEEQEQGRDRGGAEDEAGDQARSHQVAAEELAARREPLAFGTEFRVVLIAAVRAGTRARIRVHRLHLPVRSRLDLAQAFEELVDVAVHGVARVWLRLR